LTERTYFYSFPSWLLGDHLGSTSMATDDTGVLVSEARYSAFGEVRYDSGTMTTDYLYTGQREEAEVGLYYYVARWYDPAIGRFVQADSVVPNPGSALGYDRYSYGYNNPVKHNDPSGHEPICLDGEQCFDMDLPAQTPSETVTRVEHCTRAPDGPQCQNPALVNTNAEKWKELIKQTEGFLVEMAEYAKVPSFYDKPEYDYNPIYEWIGNDFGEAAQGYVLVVQTAVDTALKLFALPWDAMKDTDKYGATQIATQGTPTPYAITPTVTPTYQAPIWPSTPTLQVQTPSPTLTSTNYPTSTATASP